MKEQIEKHELSESIYMSGYGLDRKDCDDIAEQLYHEGYCKQIEGEWEKASEFMPIYRCSVCKERNLFKNGNNVFSNFCPNCGAKMKGGAEGRNNEADIPTNSFKWDERVHNRGGWDGFCDGY